MALNWKSAQSNEKKFWADIYLNKNFNDLVYSKTNLEGWIGFAKIILKRHKINKNFFIKKKVLDLGSGPGGIIAGLCKIIPSNSKCKYICADPLMNFFKNKIGILKQKKNLILINSSGEKLPIKNESLDIVFCSNVLDHCENAEKVIQEVFRILKPGGIFCPSLHLVYNKFSMIKFFFKYIDKNHPHHFIESHIFKMLNKKFSNIKVTKKVKINEDQPSFSFVNIFKNPSKLRGLKRFLSNYILYTCYFTCRK